MANINAEARGTMVRRGNVWQINNAFVEDVSTRDGRTGYLLVSYAVIAPNNLTMIELLRLNVGRNTIITNQFGRTVRLSDIRPGMWVNAFFSPAMTRSIPPQTNAFRITVLQNTSIPIPPLFPIQPFPPSPPSPPGPPSPPLPPSVTTTDRVAGVDTRNHMLVTGNPNDINRQKRFIVTDDTVI